MSFEPPDDFEDAIAYLASFTDYEQAAAHLLSRRSLDLGRMERNASRFGLLPHPMAIIHVAGSKGKGSTSIFADAILRNHGLTTGRFLSPHLVHITERIALRGQSISSARFAELVNSLRPQVDPLIRSNSIDVPTFFEAIALMALTAFAEAGCDAAVFEVGLGGRLDATNIVTPKVCLITSIDLEHTRVLGDDLASIAREKAGIIKTGVPVICGVPRESEAGEAIESVAAMKKAPITWLDNVFTADPQGSSFDLHTSDWGETQFQVSAAGDHQLRNAALAALGVATLLASGNHMVQTQAIQDALRDTTLPARLQWLPAKDNPVGRSVLLDSAHTRDSMEALAAEIDRRFDGRPVALLTALLADKDPRRCLQPLKGRVSHIFTTEVDSPRRRPAEALACTLRECWPEIPITPLGHSLKELIEIPLEQEIPLVVAGSTYLAGEVLGQLRPFPSSPDGV